MPNRILRDWTASEKVGQLTVYAERFFTRLIMKADDYGLFYANEKLLKAHLFPLLIDQVREADISRWITECETAGLIVLHKIELKSFIQIVGFNQRLRIKKARFPVPIELIDDSEQVDDKNDGHDDGHMSDTRQSDDGVKRSRSRKEVEKNIVSANADNTNSGQRQKLPLPERQQDFYTQLKPFLPQYDAKMLRSFYDYWSEASHSGKKMRMEMERTWDVTKRLARWKLNQDNFSGGGSQNQVDQPKVNVR